MTNKSISRGWQGKQVSSFGNFRRDRKANNPTFIPTGQILYYDFGNGLSYDGAASTVNDLSTSGFTGTLTNGPTYDTVNNGVLTFDGVNDYVDAGTSATLNTHPISFCVWAKFKSFTPALQNVVYNQNASFNRGQYGLIVKSNGTWVCQPNVTDGTDVLGVNIWYFFSGVRSGNNTLSYKNGRLIKTDVQSLTGNGTRLTIGADTNNNRYMDGQVGQVVLYNRVLTNSEILQNFNATRARYGV
jgi:hypothetical protein